MVDDVLGLGKATAEALSLLKEPVKALCGPAYEQLAGAWGDSVKHWREMRQLDLALDAVKKLKDKGVSPQAVAPSLLFPILDSGALEDDPDLRARWVAMLANAADPQSGHEVRRPFASILAELSPQEVAVLDYLAAKCVTQTQYGEELYIASAQHLKEALGLSPDTFGVIHDNFLRLGLIMPEGGAVQHHVATATVGERSFLAAAQHHLVLNRLGIMFVNACRV